MRAVAPKGKEIQVRSVEHQFDADEHDNGVAAEEGAGEADGKEHGGDGEAAGERVHLRFLSGIASVTAPISAAVSISAMISSARTCVVINFWPIARTGAGAEY